MCHHGSIKVLSKAPCPHPKSLDNFESVFFCKDKIAGTKASKTFWKGDTRTRGGEDEDNWKETTINSRTDCSFPRVPRVNFQAWIGKCFIKPCSMMRCTPMLDSYPLFFFSFLVSFFFIISYGYLYVGFLIFWESFWYGYLNVHHVKAFVIRWNCPSINMV